MEEQTDRLMGKRTDRWLDKCTDRWMEEQTDRWMDDEDRWMDKQIDRWNILRYYIRHISKDMILWRIWKITLNKFILSVPKLIIDMVIPECMLSLICFCRPRILDSLISLLFG